MLKRISIVLFILSLFSWLTLPKVNAGCGRVANGCGTCGIYNNTSYVHHEKIVAPVALPVVIPATVFQYLPAVSTTSVTNVQAPTATKPAPNPDLDKLVREKLEEIIKEQTQTSEDIVPISRGPSVQSPFIAKTNTNEFASLLVNKCYQCHNNNKKAGGVQIFENNTFKPNVNSEILADAIKSGRMPKNGTLTSREMLVLLTNLVN